MLCYESPTMQRSLPKKRLAIGQQSEFVCQSSLNLNSAQISHREMSLPHINSYSFSTGFMSRTIKLKRCIFNKKS